MAVRFEPGMAIAHYYRGLCYYNDGKIDMAIEAFNTSLGEDPGFAAADFNRGLCFYQKGLIERARADFSSVVLINSRFFYTKLPSKEYRLSK